MNFNKFVDEFLMYLFMNLNEFIERSEWIYWGILVNSLRNPSEFIEESEWIHGGILVNSLKNPSEFIKES